MYIENKVRHKIFFSLVLNIILLIICFINVAVNNDTYKKVLSNNYLNINKLEDLNTNNKFVYIDLTKAELQAYSLENKSEKINIYLTNIDDKNILVLLKENTILTSNTPVEIMDDNYVTEDIKQKIKDKEYHNKVISNINYNLDRSIILYKIYIILGVIFITTIGVIFDIFGIISPTRTKLYKRYNKY